MRTGQRFQRILGHNKESPFIIDFVERGISSTSFELTISPQQYNDVSMYDLFLFVQAQLCFIYSGKDQYNQKLNLSFVYNSQKLHKNIQNNIFANDQNTEAD